MVCTTVVTATEIRDVVRTRRREGSCYITRGDQGKPY